MLSSKELEVINYILMNLRRGGYFRGTLREIAETVGISMNEVMEILRELQKRDLIVFLEVNKSLRDKNLKKLIEAIESLMVEGVESTGEKVFLENFKPILNRFRRRNFLLNKLVSELKKGSLDEKSLSDLHKVEKSLAGYRLVIKAELETAEKVAEKLAKLGKPIDEDSLIVLHKLILRCFPLVANSLGTLNIDEAKIPESLKNELREAGIDHIYVIDGSMLAIYTRRMRENVNTVSRFLKEHDVRGEAGLMLLSVALTLKRDIDVLNRVRHVMEVLNLE